MREYAHAVLYAGGKFSVIDFHTTWAYLGIESGLATCFVSSFKNNPHVPGGEGGESLDNTRSLASLQPGSMISVDGLYGWGGAFWELRKLLGPKAADKILVAAWQNTDNADIRRNDPHDFIAQILKADSHLEKGQHQVQIKDLFARRGLPVG